MPEEPQPRRLLVATGVTTGLVKSADRLAGSVDRIAGLFEEKFGYERVKTLGLNPTREDMRHGLYKFAMTCKPADFVTIYHTGHADIVAEKHRLWMGDTDNPLLGALPTSELAELMLYDTPVSNLLIILDTCLAGQGSTEALVAGLRAAGNFSGKTLLTITSAHPKEQVRAGDFADLFERSINSLATAGYEPPYLPLSAIVSNIKKDPKREKWQTVSYSTILGTGDEPFLPNPRYDTALHGLDVATQLELQMEHDEQRRQDLETFFGPRARGVDRPQEVGWYFVGRHAVLRELTAWLTDQRDRGSVVITGDPGSGKSAVIGRLAMLSDRDWSRTVPRQGIPADTMPPTGSIDVAILARNLTSEQVFQALCAAAHVKAATPGEFLQRRAGKPMVAAIDAIDEAVDPRRLVEAVLNPLLEAGPQAGFRLLLGTRSYLLDRLSQRADRIDLDDQEYADPESLRAYAEKLLNVTARSVYADADPALVRAVADAVAQAAGQSFLVARITSRTLAVLPYLADPDDQLWKDNLPSTAAEAMRQDLVTRLRDEADKACDLLRPLAYAGGNGLPWEDIWAPLASLLAGREYLDKDLMWLRQNAGSYVVEAVESGRSVYRLYHAALAEYLRQGEDHGQVNGKFVTYLLSHVPRAGHGERSWPEAHPYILSHLATHAAAAGDLTALVADPCYLACAAPPGLLAAFDAAGDAQTRAVAVAYERAMHRLRSSDVADRLSYLEFAAWRARAPALAERIAAYPLRRTWTVRWTQWPPDYPHRVLAGHHGAVREVVSVSTGNRAPQAASVGDDGTLRLWDLGTAEQIGMRQVSQGPLAAIDLVELPGPRQIALVLSADGVLTSYELPSLARLLRFPVHSGLRGVLQAEQLIAAEMRCLQLPDGRWAVVTGGPGMMTAIWDPQAGTPIARLSAGIRPARLQFGRLAAGAQAVGVDMGLNGERIFDLATGQRIRTTGTISQATDFVYYAVPGGTPIIGVRSDSRGHTYLMDLTGGRDGSWAPQRVAEGADVWLADGAQVRLIYTRLTGVWSPFIRYQGDEKFKLLFRTARQPHSNVSAANIAKHARLRTEFPFIVNLDGRTIVLSPRGPSTPARRIVVLTGHGADATDADIVTVHDKPAALVSSGTDGTVRLWDISAGTEGPAERPAGDPSTAQVSVSPQQDVALGVVLATAPEKPATVTDLRTGEAVAQLTCPSGLIVAATCGWIPEVGHAAITFLVDGHALIWRLPSGTEAGVIRTYLGAVRTRTDRLPGQAAYVPLAGRPLVITCGHGAKAIVWDLAGKRIHNVLGGHAGLVSALACGSDGDGTLVAATGGQDNRVNIWNIVNGRRISRFKIVKRLVYVRQRDAGSAALVSMVMTGRRFIVLVMCEDGKLRLFRKRRWQLGYQRAELDTDGASSLAVMRLGDGRAVALTGSRGGRLCAWDIQAALAGNGDIMLLDIETEVFITSLSVVDDDTVVLSTLNGLAALRLDTGLL